MKRASAKKAAGKRKKTSNPVEFVTGRPITTVGREFTLIRTKTIKKSALRSEDTAHTLLEKTSRALSKPGISHRSVFRDAHSGVFAYSAYDADPSKVVRKSADGTKTIGRVVGGKFKAR